MKHKAPLFRADQRRLLFSVVFYTICYVYFCWLSTGFFPSLMYCLAGLACGVVAMVASIALSSKPASMEIVDPVFTLRDQRAIYLIGLSLPLLMVLASIMPEFDQERGIQPEMSLLGYRLNPCNRLKRTLKVEFQEFAFAVTEHLLVDPKSEDSNIKLRKLYDGELAHHLIDRTGAKRANSSDVDLLALKSLAPSFIGHEDHLRISAINFNTITKQGLVKLEVDVEDKCAGTKNKKLSYSLGLYKPNMRPIVVEVIDHSLPGKTCN